MIKLAMICEKDPAERQRIAAVLKRHRYKILECPDHESGLAGLSLAPDLVIIHLEPDETYPCSMVDRLRELLKSLGESQRIFASWKPADCWRQIQTLDLPCDDILPLAAIRTQAA